MLGLQNEREWAVFCDKVLQNAPLATCLLYTSRCV